jgi:arylsulfatase A-like enzyme
VRTERYKLIYFYEPEVNEWELYDLKKDPQEMRSVYNDPAYTDVVKEMKKELQKLRDQYQDDGSVVEFPKTPRPKSTRKRRTKNN